METITLNPATGPAMHDQYTSPGFDVPHPDAVWEACQTPNNLIFCHGVTVVKLSPEVVVKFGAHVKTIEAKNMIYVAQNSRVPLPRVFAYYTYGPIDRDIGDYGSLYDTYIFMSFIDGKTLHDSWESLDATSKCRVSNQLATYVQEIRDMNSFDYIGSVENGPVTDHSLSTSPDKGPFKSERDFNTALLNTYQKRAPKRHIKSFLDGMLSQSHEIVFTHGDLRPQNIMIKEGSVVAIIDWELSGWYPEYWEFAKAFLIWRWQNDWTDYLMKILQ
ncbi:hypothetical protein N7535_008814, partial [Penicillium sp. DV-2018c]